ncbi:MAG: PaaI family thioesterase [Gemmataceae bacterium]
MSMPEWVRKVLAGEGSAPILQLLGIRPKAIEPGHAIFEMDVDERHHNPLGTLHGGIYCDLADVAMGIAYAASLPDGETFTTIELKVNYLRAVVKGRLAAEARLVKGGRTVGYLECDVTDEQGRLAARVASTCLRLAKAP